MLEDTHGQRRNSSAKHTARPAMCECRAEPRQGRMMLLQDTVLASSAPWEGWGWRFFPFFLSFFHFGHMEAQGRADPCSPPQTRPAL